GRLKYGNDASVTASCQNPRSATRTASWVATMPRRLERGRRLVVCVLVACTSIALILHAPTRRLRPLAHASAVQRSLLFLYLIDLDAEAGAVDALAVGQPEREDVQGAAHHRIIGDQLRIHHRALHVRAGALHPA